MWDGCIWTPRMTKKCVFWMTCAFMSERLRCVVIIHRHSKAYPAQNSGRLMTSSWVLYYSNSSNSLLTALYKLASAGKSVCHWFICLCQGSPQHPIPASATGQAPHPYHVTASFITLALSHPSQQGFWGSGSLVWAPQEAIWNSSTSPSVSMGGEVRYVETRSHRRMASHAAYAVGDQDISP